MHRPVSLEGGNVKRIARLVPALVLSLALVARGEIKTQTVEYKDGDTTLKGYLAYDDATQGKRPGVLVIPEWWGLNDYVKSRAEQLAKLGYVAFVADIYGDGFITADPKVAGQKSGEAKKSAQLRSRGKLALEQLKANERVDPQNVAAIGYCFGGAGVLELARGGEELKGVVSFHGALDTQNAAQEGAIKSKVLVLHGDADPLVPPEQVQAFEEEMKKAKADYKIIRYAGAKHAFTNPDADKYGLPPVSYNEAADQKSWQDMQAFFAEVFGDANPKSTVLK
jgi:dienelactone hydrolase